LLLQHQRKLVFTQSAMRWINWNYKT